MIILIFFILLLCLSYILNKDKIPNIIHFVFGLKPQNEVIYVYLLFINT